MWFLFVWKTMQDEEKLMHIITPRNKGKEIIIIPNKNPHFPEQVHPPHCVLLLPTIKETK